MYYECKKKCKKLLAESPWLRKLFLSQKLQSAINEGRDQEANEIKAIMRGENQRRTWRSINQGLGKTRTPAPTMVEMEEETGKVQHRTKEGVEAAIHEELDTRFDRASSARSATVLFLNCSDTTRTLRQEWKSWRGRSPHPKGRTRPRL